MTLVIGINLGDGILITADSRVTTTWQRGLSTRVDCCQKVFRIAESTIVGFCGHLVAIADMLSFFYYMNQLRPDFLDIDILVNRLPLGLKSRAEEFMRINGWREDLGLIVGGKNGAGVFKLFSCQSPDYQAIPIEIYDTAVIGSGAPIVERMRADVRRNLPLMIRKQMKPFDDMDRAKYVSSIVAHNINFTLASHVEREVENDSLSSVGRIFHTIYIDAKNVWPIPYESLQLNELCQPELNIGTRYENGKWVQFRKDGTEIELVSPIEIVQNDKLLKQNRTL